MTDPSDDLLDVHYRLYRSPRDEHPTVICVQWFDYPDYEDARFLDEERYGSEAEALAALDACFPVDLRSFLAARIDEDAASVRVNWNRDGLTDERWWGTPFQPSRVLAECEAKRRIVDGANYWIERTQSRRPDMTPTQRVTIESRARAAEETLRLLALPYADHPDYDEDWKP